MRKMQALHMLQWCALGGFSLSHLRHHNERNLKHMHNQ
jgi:hypothetical protein